MLGVQSLDALNRIAARAQDVMRAYTPGSFAMHGDVTVPQAPRFASDPLSVAAPPNAYFVTRNADGARTFTRDGSFAVGNDGMLRTADGAAVLGFPNGSARGAVAEPLRVNDVDRALGRCADVRVDSDGTLAYTRTSIDPRTREKTVERAVAGRIALARFPAGTDPVKIDSTHAAAPYGVVPHIGTASDGTFGGIMPHSRDGGMVDMDQSLAKLSEAYIAFSALHAAQKAHGSVDKVAMDLVK